jgi:N-acetylmuramoyl-L-alanine amidase
MARPRIITARSIGLRFRPNHSTMGPEREVTGHYSATPRARDWRAGVQSALSFHRSHLAQGWAGIGYHYLIADDGAIICCRPVLWVGAHVLAQNDGRVGVNMPGTTGDRPTRRQARALNWLLHNAHTGALPRVHRTDNDLSRLPIRGHRQVPGQATSCPGLFLGMYTRRGLPWRDEVPEEEPDFLDPTEEDEELPEPSPGADEAQTGPDEEEATAEIDPDEAGELPEADEAFDEDLSEVVAELEGRNP